MIPKTRAYQIETLLEGGNEFSVLRAEQLAKEWVAAEPASPEAHFQMGQVLLFQGKEEEALSRYEQAIQLAPDFFRPWFGKAAILFAMRDSKGAGDAAIEAIAKASNAAEKLRGLFLIGCIHLFVGNYDKVLLAHSQIVEMGFKSEILMIACWLQNDLLLLAETLQSTQRLQEFTTMEYLVATAGPPEDAFLVHHDLIAKLKSLMKQGYSPREIFQAIELPSAEVAPGSKGYVSWWKDELSNPEWETSVLGVLGHGLGLGEKLQVSHEELSPLERLLKEALVDDEPTTDEERRAIVEGKEEFQKRQTISHDEFMKELGRR